MGQLPRDVVPSCYLRLCLDDMIFVAAVAVEGNPTVYWRRVVDLSTFGLHPSS